MEPRVATGILLYRLQRTPEFLLIHDSYSHRRHWTPPKGYLIGKEDELKCALRSTTELTGLQAKDILVEDGYAFKITYLSDSKPKQITYFLAQISDFGKIGASEGTAFGWFTPEQANEKVIYRSMQDVITKATEAIIDIVKSKLAQLAQNPTSIASSSSGVAPRRNIGAMPSDRSPITLAPQRTQPSTQIRRTYNSSSSSSSSSNNNNNNNNNNGYNHQDDDDDNFGEIKPSGSTHQPPRRPTNDLSSPSHNPLYKTKLCERFEKEGSCPYDAKCVFAHGVAELKERPVARTPPVDQGSGSANSNPLRKTKLCARFMAEGSCPYGEKCVFAHGEAELRAPPPPIRDQQQGSSGQGGNYQRDRSPASSNNGSSRPYSNPGNGLAPSQQPPRTGYSSGNNNYPPSFLSPMDRRSPQESGSGSFSNPKNEAFHSNRDQRNQKSQRREDRQVSKNGDTDKSWMKVVEYSEADKERFRIGSESNKVENLVKKMDKLKIEDQVEAELKEFFSVTHSLEDEVKEVTRKELRHNFSTNQLLVILLHAIMEGGDYAGKLKSRLQFFQTFVNNEEKQLAFLKAWEKFISRTPGSESQVLHVMKCLYEIDLVEEEAFIHWHQSDVNNTSAFHQKGLPFIKWLQMTDAESE